MFVQVPIITLRDFLEARGFVQEEVPNAWRFNRPCASNPLLWVTVVLLKEPVEKVNGFGEQALRVVLMGHVETANGVNAWALRDTPDIHRTGSLDKVLARVEERIAHAEHLAGTYGGPCIRCHSVTYADSARCVRRACRDMEAA